VVTFPVNTYVTEVSTTIGNYGSTNQQAAIATLTRTKNAAGATHPVSGTANPQSITVAKTADTAISITNAAAGGGTAYWQPHTAVNFIIKY
jgi:hypothetical protein